ncbi:MAG: hypothetical protein JXR96_24740 [Deltaproteobacteria bacterium]|nr:hypothetical protein [Deltaproteobacteria bacterium]
MFSNRIAIPTLLGLLFCALAPTAAADEQERDAKYYQQRFDHYSKVIATLKEDDAAEVASQEIELIRTWIGQAQAFLASEKLDAIEPLIKRMDAQAEYIRAKIERSAAEAAAQEAEDIAAAAEKKAAGAKVAAETAEKKMKAFEAEGL